VDDDKLMRIWAIAERARTQIIATYDAPEAACYDASEVLAAALRNAGIAARRVQGTFYLDEPDPSKYDEDMDEAEMHEATHHWVEVGPYIVDVTADQFADESEDEIPPIVLGRKKDLWRYTPVKK
jgi:hypothetical protein